jgi:hypothetical protein
MWNGVPPVAIRHFARVFDLLRWYICKRLQIGKMWGEVPAPELRPPPPPPPVGDGVYVQNPSVTPFKTKGTTVLRNSNV